DRQAVHVDRIEPGSRALYQVGVDPLTNRLRGGTLDDVVAERRLHDATDCAGRKAPACAVEGRYELPLRAGWQETVVPLAAGIFRKLGRELAEIGTALDLCEGALGLFPGGVAHLGRR